MLTRIRQRLKIIPTRVKVIPVLILLVAIGILHAWLLNRNPMLAMAVRGLFLLPLFMASLLFGLKGGLICAAVISAEYLVIFLDNAISASFGVFTMVEIGLTFLTGAITGALVDREAREAQRLKKAERLALLGMAAAAVAHELKNPLVAIGGFTQRVYRDLEPEHPHREKLAIVVEQVAHMEALLREMLDYSRPVELDLKRYSLNRLVEEVLVMAAPQAEQAKVELVTRLSPRDPAPRLDAGRMKQVLLNLVLNAVQASPQGGRVEVRTRRAGRGQVAVEVRDQGVGIPPEELEKIFLPFFTTKPKGTGLGLAISHKLVEAHGGRLEVESTPGQGSTFTVVLPLNPVV